MLMGRANRGWQDTDTVLSYFGSRRKEATLRYEEFVREEVPSFRARLSNIIS